MAGNLQPSAILSGIRSQLGSFHQNNWQLPQKSAGSCHRTQLAAATGNCQPASIAVWKSMAVAAGASFYGILLIPSTLRNRSSLFYRGILSTYGSAAICRPYLSGKVIYSLIVYKSVIYACIDLLLLTRSYLQLTTHHSYMLVYIS